MQDFLNIQRAVNTKKSTAFRQSTSFKKWCEKRDLNPYVKDTRTSNVPVCQFQHSRI